MENSEIMVAPSGHTKDGGVLLGDKRAPRRLVLFEDPQCPYCREFEEVSGEMLLQELSAATVSIEYRMRSFLGIESVRADNALALAAELGHFNDLRLHLFAAQPEEQTGGFTVPDLIELGRQVNIEGSQYEQGGREGRYQRWVVEMDQIFQELDPEGTPAAALDGKPIDQGVLYNPSSFRGLLRS
jgi:protein-disulfide isomerase